MDVTHQDFTTLLLTIDLGSLPLSIGFKLSMARTVIWSSRDEISIEVPRQDEELALPSKYNA